MMNGGCLLFSRLNGQIRERYYGMRDSAASVHRDMPEIRILQNVKIIALSDGHSPLQFVNNPGCFSEGT